MHLDDLPSVAVELAFGSDPWADPDDDGWTDVAAYTQGISVRRGRASELDTFPASTATMSLLNNDRRFDPLHDAGPHAGDLVANVPARIRARWDETAGATSVTYVGIGALAAADNTSLTPALPGSWAAGDLLLVVASIRNSGTGTVDTPDGWRNLMSAGNVSILGRIAQTGDTAPTVTFSGGAAGATTLAQCLAFRGTERDLTRVLSTTAEQLNASAQNIAVPAMTAVEGNNAIVMVAWKQDDWTSVGQLSGQFFTEVADAPSTAGSDAAHQIQYKIPVAATNVSATTITVTGGAAAISRVLIFAVRPYRGTDYDVWRGYVDGWPVEYLAGGAQSRVALACTDAFRLFAERRMPDTVAQAVTDIATPKGWFHLDRLDGNRLTNTAAGATLHGWAQTTLSTGPALVGASTGSLVSPEFTPDTDVRLAAAAIPIPSDFASMTADVEWSFTVAVRAAQGPDISSGDHELVTTTAVTGQELMSLTVSIFGRPTFTVDGVGATIAATVDSSLTGGINLYDGATHVVTCVRDNTEARLYVDGALIGSDSDASANDWWQQTNAVHWIGRTGVGDGSRRWPAMAFDELIWFPVALSDSEVQALYDAMTVAWQPPAPAGTVIAAALDLAGWPADLRALDPGETVVTAPFNPAGLSVLEVLQAAAEADQGRLFMDPAGRVVFHDRGRALREATAADVQYTFQLASAGGAGALDGTLQVAMDDLYVFDAAEVTREGGEAQRAQASATPARTRSLDGLWLAQDAQSLNLAEWIVARYGTAVPRVRTWSTDPRTEPDDWPTLLGLDVGHRVEHSFTPGGIGDPLELAVWLEQVDHDMTPARWVMSFGGAPVDQTNYLLWAASDGTADDDHGWADTDQDPPGGAWG